MLDKLRKISVEVGSDHALNASYPELPLVWEYLATNKSLEEFAFDDFEYPGGLPLSGLFSIRWPFLKRFTLIRFGNRSSVSTADVFLEFLRGHEELQALRIDNWALNPDSNSKSKPIVILPHLVSLHIHPSLIPIFHETDLVTSLTISRAHNFSRTGDHDVILASSRYREIKFFEICANGCQSGEGQAEHYIMMYKMLQSQFSKLEELRIRYSPWRENKFLLVCLP